MYKGLSPYEIVPMPGTHKRVKNDAQKARAFYPGRYECHVMRQSRSR